jgi:hypothetical protein
MNDVPVGRKHREWALRSVGEEIDPANVVEPDSLTPEELSEAYAWLDTGVVAETPEEPLQDEDRFSLKLINDAAQAFANFEFEIRADTDAALKEAKEHAKALDSNWDRHHRISLDAIRASLGLSNEASVHDVLNEINKLKDLVTR